MYNYKDSIHDKQQSLYRIKRKKRMFCPACQNGKMSFYKQARFWQCDQCGYRIFQKELDNNCLFWFCDECGAFLNNQDGFNQDSYYHICTSCNHKNYLDAKRLKNICRICGSIIDDDKKLCDNCKQNRKEKLADVGMAALGVAVVAGAVYLEYLASRDDDDDEDEDDGSGFLDYLRGTDYTYDPDNLQYGDTWLANASEDELNTEREKVRLAYVKEQDDDEAERLYDLLHAFDDELSDRAWGDETPHAPTYHTEHGWYLSEDD